MADAISPRGHQYVGQWPDLPSSAATAHDRQHYGAAWLVRPVLDKYALATDKRANVRTQKDIAIA